MSEIPWHERLEMLRRALLKPAWYDAYYNDPYVRAAFEQYLVMLAPMLDGLMEQTLKDAAKQRAAQEHILESDDTWVFGRLVDGMPVLERKDALTEQWRQEVFGNWTPPTEQEAKEAETAKEQMRINAMLSPFHRHLLRRVHALSPDQAKRARIEVPPHWNMKEDGTIFGHVPVVTGPPELVSPRVAVSPPAEGETDTSVIVTEDGAVSITTPKARFS